MDNNERKKLKVDDRRENEATDDRTLTNFLNWLKKENFELSNKVYISKTGSCAGYGLIAASDIETGVILFTIPRSAILWQTNSSIKDVIASELPNIHGKSGWVPLLITLMCEYLNPNSRWRPYLDIMPDNYAELDHPMFWENSMLDELAGTDLKSLIETDLRSMKEDFDVFVVPFFKRHPNLTELSNVSFELFKKMTAFVMAYSFTDLSNPAYGNNDENKDNQFPPMMVPLADILNHVAKNNANLIFGKQNLQMISTSNIKKGQEIFNTYGHLSNVDLLHMYGFAELYPKNHYDLVEVPICLIFQEYEKLIHVNKASVNLIRSLGLYEGESFTVGFNGIFEEDTVERVFKLLYSDLETIREFDYNGVCDDDDEEASDRFANENLKHLPSEWKAMLIGAAKQRMLNFKGTLAEDEELINSSEKLDKLSRRLRWALYIKYGQKMLLHNFIQFLSL